MPANRPLIIGHHLIWTLYGHWLPSDLRGSGSDDVRDPKLSEFGDAHLGRKPEQMQPSRREIKEFYRQAAPLLQFRPFWIDEATRQALARAIREVVRFKPYTAWACAILSNHLHMVVRRHRDDAATNWRTIAEATRVRLREFDEIVATHPVWASRPYKVFLSTERDVHTRVRYVEDNPRKEGLAPQAYHFVAEYDGWPHRRRPN
jgi:REP element-mobilizing transposase RayT